MSTTDTIVVRVEGTPVRFDPADPDDAAFLAWMAARDAATRDQATQAARAAETAYHGPSRASAEARVNTLRGSRRNVHPPRPSLLAERNLLPEAPPPEPPRTLAQSRRAIRQERARRAARVQPGTDAAPPAQPPATPIPRHLVLATPRLLTAEQDAQLRLPSCPALPVVTVHATAGAVPPPPSGFAAPACDPYGPARRVRRVVGFQCTPCPACNQVLRGGDPG